MVFQTYFTRVPVLDKYMCLWPLLNFGFVFPGLSISFKIAKPADGQPSIWVRSDIIQSLWTLDTRHIQWQEQLYLVSATIILPIPLELMMPVGAHIYIQVKSTFSGSCNGLSPVRRQSHYLNPCWRIANWTLKNKLRITGFLFFFKKVLRMSSAKPFRHDDVIKLKHFRVTGHLCGNSPVPGEFPAQRPVTRSFDVFFDLRLNKRLSKQSWGWWFETLSCPLWRHRNGSCFQLVLFAYIFYKPDFGTIIILHRWPLNLTGNATCVTE